MPPILNDQPSPARQARREHILRAAHALIGVRAGPSFDPFHTDLFPIDVVMVAGSPWLRDGLERDFVKDESGYRKLGGSANTPSAPYFFRSSFNLIHYLKRTGFYIPRGGSQPLVPGMACFFDWEDRGRFNFTPDRSGIVIAVENGQASTVVLATRDPDDIDGKQVAFEVRAIDIEPGDTYDRALIGYADLP